MSVLDLLADVARDGTAEGVGIHATPADWERALGPDFVDDRAKKRFRRDYGLVELGFWRVDGEWRCGLLSLQVHRLWWGSDKLGPLSLRAKYGDYPTRVPFTDLRSRLPELRYIEDSDVSEYERYYVPDSKVTIMVATSTVDGGPPAGSVWALHLTDEPDIALRPR